MAHEITAQDGMFSVREKAWHGLGAVLPEYPTRAEAQQLAHPWEPIATPLFIEEPSFETRPVAGEDGSLIEEPITHYDPVTGYRAIQRSDTGSVLGVVSDTYQPVSNTEMWDIAEALEGESSGDVMYETAGSLKGGSKVWILVRLKRPLMLKGDEETATIPYYALQNSHDGLGSFRGQATVTRIVCQNTAQLADLEAGQRGTSFTFRHTRNVGDRIEEARDALAGWRESVEAYRMLAEHFADERISIDQAGEFVERFIPDPPPATATDRVMRNAAEARGQWRGIYMGEANERLLGTRWGLVQASVEYLQWARKAHSEETRFQRSMLTQSRLMQDAMDLAKAV